MNHRTDNLTFAFGLAAATIGIVASAGYALDLPDLLRAPPDHPAILLAAALGLMLGGGALTVAAGSPSRARHWLIRGPGVVMAAFALLAMGDV